jgi:hypothetical protein
VVGSTCEFLCSAWCSWCTCSWLGEGTPEPFERSLRFISAKIPMRKALNTCVWTRCVHVSMQRVIKTRSITSCVCSTGSYAQRTLRRMCICLWNVARASASGGLELLARCTYTPSRASPPFIDDEGKCIQKWDKSISI